MPQETRPIYRSWIRSPQTDTTMQISQSPSIRHRISSCFVFPLPRQHLTLGSEEFHSLAELKMWFTVVTAHTNAVIPRLQHCKPSSLAAFVPWYKNMFVDSCLTLHTKIWSIKDKRAVRQLARIKEPWQRLLLHSRINSDGAGYRLKCILFLHQLACWNQNGKFLSFKSVLTTYGSDSFNFFCFEGCISHF